MTTLMLSAAISTIVMMLWATVQLDTQVAANGRIIAQVKLAAASGITHFSAVEIDLAAAEDGQAIPETRLTAKTAYRVDILRLHRNRIMVTSWGQYKRAGRIILEYPIRMIIERD